MYASLAKFKSRSKAFEGTTYDDIDCIDTLRIQSGILDGKLAQFYALPVSVCAPAVLTFAGNVSADDTVTIGAKTYTYKASPAAANDVDLGATAALSVINLKRAINEGTNGGSYHADTTVNVDVEATRSSLVLTLTARVPGPDGDDLTLSKSATNITITSSFAGGLRKFETLEQLVIWMSTLSLLGGQANSVLSGGGNKSSADDIAKVIEDTIKELAISGSLVDTAGTTRTPESNVPVTNADTYPIADMSDPVNWQHDDDRDFDRE